ncbi:hypothetical protein KDD17_12335 [Sulfitobacter albidus]|uniref:DUF6473 domain-containing protein n=1 Tax=Sulfitobacter albidus TaxID=2829501 RepID=A0A975JC24_9RHOB|nr:DUF6473 family protein [Sulfitobacter albidus]QUJ75734.1 hypothetical protein KDD17_12335 [Sulfitobacter albidus]
MTCDVLGPQALDYMPCAYGASRLRFRGPARPTDGRFTAFMGGALTYGSFIERPFPMCVEHGNGVVSVNLGQPTMGVDMLLRDPAIPQLAGAAAVTVIEVPGAINLSNNYYRVHPRRNDRFVQAAPVLRRLYPDVDFARFHFTQHLTQFLRRHDPERFELVAKSLQRAWQRRMSTLLDAVAGPAVLLWLGEGAPPARGGLSGSGMPPLVSAAMLDALTPACAAQVQITYDAPDGQTDGKLFDATQERAAGRLPGPQVHEHIARTLVPVIDDLMIRA